MKKLILLASVAIAVIAYQPAKAQVSLSINIGSAPSYYEPDYYGYRTYYAPVRTVVYRQPVVYHRPVVYHKRYVNYKTAYAPSRVYHTSYSRPVNRYYIVKGPKNNGHGNRGRGHGRH
jgi:hypothetical protein